MLALWQARKSVLRPPQPSTVGDGAGDAQTALFQAQGAMAEMKLIQRQLADANLVAPFDEIVLKGDLDDKVGTQRLDKFLSGNMIGLSRRCFWTRVMPGI